MAASKVFLKHKVTFVSRVSLHIRATLICCDNTSEYMREQGFLYPYLTINNLYWHCQKKRAFYLCKKEKEIPYFSSLTAPVGALTKAPNYLFYVEMESWERWSSNDVSGMPKKFPLAVISCLGVRLCSHRVLFEPPVFSERFLRTLIAVLNMCCSSCWCSPASFSISHIQTGRTCTRD